MTGADANAEGFVEELAALKRRGCALLVVDGLDDATLCEEFLGHPEEPRRRIVVDAGEDVSREGDRVVVDAGSHFARSAAATSADPTDGPVPLPEVRDRIADHVERFERSGLDPGELRVCMGEISALAVGSDPETLLDFLSDVTDLVRDASGMGHVHATPDAAGRECIDSLFDVTVDTRRTPEGRQYRWYLHEADLDSGWIDV